MTTLVGEAGFSEQPDFVLPMLLLLLLFAAIGLAAYLLLQGAAEVLAGSRKLTIKLLFQAITLTAVVIVLLGVYGWLKS